MRPIRKKQEYSLKAVLLNANHIICTAHLAQIRYFCQSLIVVIVVHVVGLPVEINQLVINPFICLTNNAEVDESKPGSKA